MTTNTISYLPEPRRETWQGFEDLVELIQRKFHQGAVVTRDDRIRGKKSLRKCQVDISIRYKLGGLELLVAVECKRHIRKLDVEKVEAFIEKMKDIRADAG